jgi:hypothetical protein
MRALRTDITGRNGFRAACSSEQGRGSTAGFTDGRDFMGVRDSTMAVDLKDAVDSNVVPHFADVNSVIAEFEGRFAADSVEDFAAATSAEVLVGTVADSAVEVPTAAVRAEADTATGKLNA